VSQLTQSSALIGQRVTYLDPTTNQSMSGTVGSVKIMDNLAVLSINGSDVPLANVSEVLGPELPPAGSDTTSDPTTPSDPDTNNE
jgi:hypothetical protein